MERADGAPPQRRQRALHVAPQHAQGGRPIALLGRRGRHRLGGQVPRAEPRRRQLGRPLHLDVADDADDHAVRRVPRPIVGAQGRGVQTPQPFLGPDPPTAHAVGAEQLGVERLGRDGARGVELAIGLLDDHLELARQLLRIDGGVHQRVSLDVQRPLQTRGRRRHDDVVRRHVVRRAGVHVAADPLDVAGDLARTPNGGALEVHVLQDVGDPDPLVGLVEVARPHVGHDRDDRRRRISLHQQDESVRQDPAGDAGGEVHRYKVLARERRPADARTPDPWRTRRRAAAARSADVREGSRAVPPRPRPARSSPRR